MVLPILHEPTSTITEQLDRMSSIVDDVDVKKPDAAGVEWLREMLATYWNCDMPVPYIFPMGDAGKISLEWFLGNVEFSMDVDFVAHTALWEWWDSSMDTAGEETIDLNLPESWYEIQKCSTGFR